VYSCTLKSCNRDVLHRPLCEDSDKIPEGGTSTSILYLSVLCYVLVTFSSEALVVPPPSSLAACPQKKPETGPAERERTDSFKMFRKRAGPQTVSKCSARGQGLQRARTDSFKMFR
jgi:hypothetical protein